MKTAWYPSRNIVYLNRPWLPPLFLLIWRRHSLDNATPSALVISEGLRSNGTSSVRLPERTQPCPLSSLCYIDLLLELLIGRPIGLPIELPLGELYSPSSNSRTNTVLTLARRDQSRVENSVPQFPSYLLSDVSLS